MHFSLSFVVVLALLCLLCYSSDLSDVRTCVSHISHRLCDVIQAESLSFCFVCKQSYIGFTGGRGEVMGRSEADSHVWKIYGFIRNEKKENLFGRRKREKVKLSEAYNNKRNMFSIKMIHLKFCGLHSEFGILCFKISLASKMFGRVFLLRTWNKKENSSRFVTRNGIVVPNESLPIAKQIAMHSVLLIMLL